MAAERHTEVLLISSDPLLSQRVQDLLAQAEYEIFDVVCESGLAHGLKRLAEGETDVVLVSSTLSDSQSLSETLAKVRGVNLKVPVVVLTSVRDGAKGTVIMEEAQDYILQERMSAGSLAYSLTHAIERNVAGVRSAFANRQFRALIENARDGIAVVNADGAICYRSPSFALALGYEEGEVEGFSGIEFVHPEDQAKAMALLAKVVSSTGVVLSHELRVRHKDGSWHCVELTASNYLDDPAIAGVVINLRDTTERKQAEEVLRESEERYRLLAEEATDVLWTMDPTTLKLNYISSSHERLTGFTVEESLAQTVDQMMPPSSVELCTRMLAEELALEASGQGAPDRHRVFDLEIYRKDGSTVWVEENVSWLRNKEGKPLAMIGAYRDITDRKRADEALRRSEERYRALADKAADVLWTMDLSTLKITYISPAHERITGFTVEETVGRTVDQMMPQQSVEKCTGMLLEDLTLEAQGQESDPNRSWVFELEILRKDGSTFWVEENVSWLRDAMGSPVGMIGIYRDVTERREAENAVADKERFYRCLIDDSPVATLIIDEQGATKYGSASVDRMLGLAKEEGQDESVFGFLHPDDVAKAVESLSQLLTNPDAPAQVELRARHKDGSWRWLEVVGTNHLADPAVGGLVINLVDVSERKHAEEAIKVQEAFFRKLIEKSNDALLVVDPQCVMRYGSSSLERVLGYSESEKIGESAFNYVHPEDVPAAATVLLQLVSTPGKSDRTELRAMHKDGSWRWLEVIGTNYLDDPAVNGVVLNLRDMTERKQVEEAVNVKERFYRRLIEKAPDGIMLLDAQGVPKYGSPNIMQLLGYVDNERPGDSALNFVHPEDMGKAAELFTKLSGNPGESCQTEIRLLHKDGNWRWFEVVATNHLDDPATEGIVINLRDVTERKQAEDALKLKEEFFRKLIQKSNDGILVLDDKGMVKYGGSSFKTMMGYVEGEKVGQSAFDLIHPDDAAVATQLFFQLAAAPGRVDRTELRALHKDGTWRWVEVLGTNHLDDPAVNGIVLNIRDTTERRQADEALRIQEKFYRRLTEKSSDGILVVDAAGTSKFGATSLTRLLGYGQQEGIGHSAFNYVHPDDVKSVTEAFMQVLANPGQSSSMEFRAKHKDGSWCWLQVLGTNYLDDPAVSGIVLNITDITERKLAEEAIRLKEEFYRRMIEKAPDGILMVDAQGTVVFESPSFTRILGYEEGENVGQCAFNYVHPEDLAATAGALAEAIGKPGISAEMEFRGLHKDGSWRWLEVTGTNHLDEPAVKGVVLNLRDITERRLADTRLKRRLEIETAISSLSTRLGNASNVDVAVNVGLGVCGRLLGATRAHVLLFNRAGDLASETHEWCAEGASSQRALLQNLSTTVFPWWTAKLRAGECIRIDDISEMPPEAESEKTLLQLAGAKSVLAFPLFMSGDFAGFIGFDNSEVTAWSEDDIVLLGVLCEIIGNALDRKRQQEERAERESLFRQLFTNVSDAIVFVDLAGKVLDVNDNVAEVFGYTKDEVVGRNFADLGLFSKDALTDISTGFAKAVSAQKLDATTLMAPAFHKDGRVIELEMRVSSLTGAQDQLLGFFAVIRDITERKHAEEALTESERRFRALVENSSDGLVLLDMLGNVKYASPATSGLIGHEYGEDLGSLGFDFIHPEDMGRTVELYAKVAATSGMSAQELVRAKHKDGSWRWLEAKASNHLDDPGVAAVVINLVDITERKRAEEALRESEERFRALIEHSSDGITVMDKNLGIKYQSPSCELIFGHGAHNLLGTAALAEVHPDDVLGLTESFDILLKTPGLVISAQCRYRHGDGTWHHMEATVQNLLDNPAVEGIVAHYRDINERRKAEEALREAERRFRAIFENPMNFVFVHDAVGTFLEANEAALKRLGYTHDDLGKLSFFDLAYPEDAQEAVTALAQTTTQGYMDKPIEMRVCGKSGEVIWVQVYGYGLTSEGEYRGLAIATDISEAKLAEEALRQSQEVIRASEKKFRTIFESANDGIVLIDLKGNIVDANSRALTMFGYSKDDAIGGNAFEMDAFSPDDLARMMELFGKMLSGSTELAERLDLLLRRKDGEVIPVDIGWQMVVDAEGSMAGVLAVIRDITERKTMENELIQSADTLKAQNLQLNEARQELANLNQGLEQKVKERTAEVERLLTQKDQFIRQLGHDLKSPLTPLMALLPMLRENIQDQERREIVEVSIENVNFMRDLVTKTLKLARLTGGKAGPTDATARMRKQLDSVLRGRKTVADKKGITIETLVDDNILVLLEEIDLQEIFDNLVTNAIKYTPEGGSIFIDAVVTEPWVTVTIKDTGIGINSEQLSHLFEEFYKADPSRHDLDSSGLGLSICKRIVENYGGRIWAESEGLGKGSTFCFTMRLAEGAKQ